MSFPDRGDGTAAARFAAALQEARTCQQRGALPQAYAACRNALRLRPLDTDALVLGGVLAYQLGRLAEATQAMRQALAVRPQDGHVWLLLAGLLTAGGALGEAEEACRKALALDPGKAAAHLELGSVLAAAGRFAEAVPAFCQALALDRRSLAAQINLGSALFRLGRLEEAEAAQRTAVELGPRHAVAWKNLAATRRAQGDFSGAAADYRRAIALQPDYAEAHRDLALLMLQQGEFRKGWTEYEWRWRASTVGAAPLPTQRWKGEALAGRRLLLHFEQGLGDTIQFLRYVPLAAARAGTLLLHVQPAMRRLAESLPGAPRVSADPAPPPMHDRHAYLMSLPHLLGDAGTKVPAEIPYLAAPADRVAFWRQCLADRAGLRVGLVASGNPQHENDRNRSIPMVLLQPLLDLPGITWIGLEVDRVPPAPQILGLGAELGDLAETAAVIETLDLVISVDTAVAHLAGALGRRVWTLLPHVSDWRWRTLREDSAWYPSMRLFRQSAAREWPETIARVAKALAAL
jgi:tetratricopeptide (TPR) repeat protein